MSRTLNFTVAALDKLAVTDRECDWIDEQVGGLRLRVYPSGTKSFSYVKKLDGNQYRLKLGKYPDLKIHQAREKAITLNGKIAQGYNPFEEKKETRSELKLSELYELYYNQHAILFTKRPKDNKLMVELHLLSVLGKLKLRDITPEKIRTLHAKIGKKSPGAANRVMQIASAVFNFGIKHGYTKENPCFGLKKFKSLTRDRFLSRDELNKFYEALHLEAKLFQDFFLLLLYTGARKSNVLSMKYADVDFDLYRWRIAESETKNKDVNIVALSQSSIDILMRRWEENKNQGSAFVFPADSKSGHLEDPKKAFQRIKDKMEVQDIRMHDLRRTFGSYMAISGASLPIIGKALNHKSQVSTAIYARLSQDAVLDAINTATNLMLKQP